MSKWIKVKDKLPPYCENVLIWTEGMGITGAYLMECDRWAIIDWDEYEQYEPLNGVSWWRYPPDLPDLNDPVLREKVSGK